MPDPDLLTLFVRPLEELGIRYMVSGSVASTLFGEPRMTHDVELRVVKAFGSKQELADYLEHRANSETEPATLEELPEMEVEES